MTKKPWVVVVILTFVGVTAVLVFAYLQRKLVEVQPITLRYVQTGQFNNGGYITSGTIFWATNHTRNTQFVMLSAIEVKVGTNWVTQSRPVLPLLFQPPGTRSTQPLLNPHDAGYATLQLSNPPAGTTWRLRVIVERRLTGIGDAWAHFRAYPVMLARRLRTGDTDIPVNPFSKAWSFSRVTDVTSQEISEE